MKESAVEKKWQTGRAKVEYMKEFPGMLAPDARTDSGETHTIREGITLHIYDDGAFAFSPDLRNDPAMLGQSLLAARDLLGSAHADAYTKLDALIEEDDRMKRLARREKLLSAIANNIAEMPELREEIPALLNKVEREGPGCDVTSIMNADDD
ncbi:MAG: hypothetical protein CL946_02935 [Ectothiorhodospiraceae bacterium]|nr:hypothetical protein [Ectothiorhodospiraceae bacterium]